MTSLLEFLRTHDEAFRSRARLASLYSDFRSQRTTNPDGYNANSSAWLRALSSAAKAGLIPPTRFVIESGEALLQELQTREYGRPLALGAVWDDAVKSGALVAVREFLEREQSMYCHQRSWMLPTTWEVVRWGLRQLSVMGGMSGEDELVKGSFVVVANVEAAAQAVIAHASKTATSDAERIFSRHLFHATFASTLGVDVLSPCDWNVLVTHLARDRNAIAYDALSGIIKFATPGQAVAIITKEDVSIASLRTVISSLTSQISNLTTQISNLDLTAREAVSSQQLLQAKTALRQKKAATSKLEQRIATLAQLEDVYAKIEQAADQVQIVRVLEQSGQALKSLNLQTGGVESVQHVMEGLREDIMDTEEMGNAITEGAMGSVDEGEVEDELEALEKVEKEKVDGEEKKKVDREEKEKREVEEAEKTRARLAELDPVTQKEPSNVGDAEMKVAKVQKETA